MSRQSRRNAVTAKRKLERENSETEDSTSTDSEPHCSGSFFSMQPQPRPKLLRTSGPILPQNELFEKACALFESPIPSKSTLIAGVWAVKLSRLDSARRILVEKAINDILFMAEMGELNRHSVQNNQFTDGISSLSTFSTNFASFTDNDTMCSSSEETDTPDEGVNGVNSIEDLFTSNLIEDQSD